MTEVLVARSLDSAAFYDESEGYSIWYKYFTLNVVGGIVMIMAKVNVAGIIHENYAATEYQSHELRVTWQNGQGPSGSHTVGYSQIKFGRSSNGKVKCYLYNKLYPTYGNSGTPVSSGSSFYIDLLGLVDADQPSCDGSLYVFFTLSLTGASTAEAMVVVSKNPSWPITLDYYKSISVTITNWSYGGSGPKILSAYVGMYLHAYQYKSTEFAVFRPDIFVGNEAVPTPMYQFPNDTSLEIDTYDHTPPAGVTPFTVFTDDEDSTSRLVNTAPGISDVVKVLHTGAPDIHWTNRGILKDMLGHIGDSSGTSVVNRIIDVSNLLTGGNGLSVLSNAIGAVSTALTTVDTNVDNINDNTSVGAEDQDGNIFQRVRWIVAQVVTLLSNVGDSGDGESSTGNIFQRIKWLITNVTALIGQIVTNPGGWFRGLIGALVDNIGDVEPGESQVSNLGNWIYNKWIRPTSKPFQDLENVPFIKKVEPE